jgi:hypothetical protein
LLAAALALIGIDGFTSLAILKFLVCVVLLLNYLGILGMLTIGRVCLVIRAAHQDIEHVSIMLSVKCVRVISLMSTVLDIYRGG